MHKDVTFIFLLTSVDLKPEYANPRLKQIHIHLQICNNIMTRPVKIFNDKHATDINEVLGQRPIETKLKNTNLCISNIIHSIKSTKLQVNFINIKQCTDQRQVN